MPRKAKQQQEVFAEQKDFLPSAMDSKPDELPAVVEMLANGESGPFFHSTLGALYCSDATEFLSAIPDETVDAIFVDPPYNIGKAEWDQFKSSSDYLKWVNEWLVQCHRTLKPEGTMYLMGFSEILAHISVMADELFASTRWLIWHYRNKPSLANKDWVRAHEGILHFRKSRSSPFYIDYIREPYNVHTRQYPERGQGKTSQYGNGKEHVWSPNQKGAKPRDVIDIPAISNGMKESTQHPTQKPEELLRRLLLAVTQSGDIVVDPFGGSGTAYVVCEQLKRQWIGSDTSEDYCELAAVRLAKVPQHSVEYWVEKDRKRVLHRRRIRTGK